MIDIPVQATPLTPFVQPTPADMRRAADIVDSHPVVSAYASSEWDELHSDGQVWAAAIVREAQARVALDAQRIADVNAFLSHMADRFRQRTMRRFFGIRVHSMTPMAAMSYALATFDASLDMLGVTFGDPEYGWDRDHAHELVDEELQHWEP